VIETGNCDGQDEAEVYATGLSCLQVIKRDKFQRRVVCAFKDHGSRNASVIQCVPVESTRTWSSNWCSFS